MEFTRQFPMKGGMRETSYANNSLLQRKVISMTKPITEAAITAFFSTIAATIPASLTIADLGCSCGPNTLFAVSEIISIMIDLCNAKKHELPEFQVFLNDLPGNDFNTLFSSYLPRFQEKLSEQMKSKYGASAALACFFNGVPGSFYGRLFAQESLHFIHSLYSLHWLSQVPRGLEENKGNISMSRSSPPSVLRAYYEQFQRDFSTFLECRGQELVMGGRMVLTLHGRRSDDPSSEEYRQFWELLAIDLNEMVTEGIIEEEKLNSFNVPYYTPSPKEVRQEVEKQGSFSIDCLEVFEVNRDVFETDFDPNVVSKEAADKIVGSLRAIAKPLLIHHFGEEIINEVFERFKAKLGNRFSKEKIPLIIYQQRAEDAAKQRAASTEATRVRTEDAVKAAEVGKREKQVKLIQAKGKEVIATDTSGNERLR